MLPMDLFLARLPPEEVKMTLPSEEDLSRQARAKIFRLVILLHFFFFFFYLTCVLFWTSLQNGLIHSPCGLCAMMMMVGAIVGRDIDGQSVKQNELVI